MHLVWASIYSSIENRVLWTESEKIGFAAFRISWSTGVLEYCPQGAGFRKNRYKALRVVFNET
jgi:hypothetical protein